MKKDGVQGNVGEKLLLQIHNINQLHTHFTIHGCSATFLNVDTMLYSSGLQIKIIEIQNVHKI
jgi:hypothetical protein